MSLLRRNENYPALSGFINDFFNRDWLDRTNHNFSETNTTLPSVNIIEGEKGYEVDMAAPGMEKKDFKIELNHGVLNISSEKKIEHETRKGERFTRREYSYQSFSRSFNLPDSADGDRITARYDNGILKLQIPRKEDSKSRAVRSIEIK
jgi:HSP20 family protein